MPSVVDPRNAEQGTTVRFNFVVLSAGLPVVPTSLVVDVQDAVTSLSTALLVAVGAGDPGKYYADWDVPLAQPLGFYRLVVTPNVGSVDPTTFELFAAGHFQQSQAFNAQSVVTQAQQLSSARNPKVFIALVRTIMRDHPQLNRLTAGRETSDGEIAIATEMAISMFNTAAPIFSSPYTFTNFPSLAWLVIGTVGWIVNSSNLLRQRNYLQYSDGGVTVETENPAGYAALAQQWYGSYLQWIPEFKKSLNLNMAFGYSPTGVHSEYFLLGTLLGAPSYPEAGILLR